MDIRERMGDNEEALRSAMEAHAAQVWTALPGIIQSFAPKAVTCTVQPAIQGSITGQNGQTQQTNLPVLVDVPVVFPRGGGFVLTHPVTAGDACLVIFASRCIDGWWQGGDVAPALSQRMHDLSDGFAFVGPFTAAGLTPPVNTEDVQLRSLDGKVFIGIKPDQTIEAVNPQASVTLSPGGDIELTGASSIKLKAPQIIIAGNLTWTGHGGGAGEYNIAGQVNLDGALASTGDQVAGGISQVQHTHTGVQPGSGNTGEPQ